MISCSWLNRNIINTLHQLLALLARARSLYEWEIVVPVIVLAKSWIVYLSSIVMIDYTNWLCLSKVFFAMVKLDNNDLPIDYKNAAYLCQSRASDDDLSIGHT